MSHLFLSENWIEAARDIRHRYSHAVPEITVEVRINIVTTKVPFGEGDIRAFIDTSSGSLEMELGSLETADLTVTTDYDTARQLFVEQDPASSMQAFMSGRIKVEGDITRLMVMQTSVPQNDTTLAVAAEIKAITA
jgi:putative sterol carrier protein